MKGVLFALASFLIGVAVLAVLPQVHAAEGPAVTVVSYEVEPAVFFPGDEGTISLTLKNTATQSSVTEENFEPEGSEGPYTRITTVSTVSAEIESVRLLNKRCVEWLSARTRSSEFFRIGALGPGESIRISFPVRVSKFCEDGTYFPEVLVSVENGEDVRFPIPVRVESSALEMLADIPPEISLGDAKEVRVTVANNRPSAVSGVCVSVHAEDGLELTPERIFVGNIEPFEQKTVNFTLSATPFAFQQKAKNAPTGERSEEKVRAEPSATEAEFKSIVFEATYKNGENEHKSVLETGVLLRNILDMHLILVDAPAKVKRGEDARIEFDVANGMEKPVSAVSVIPCEPYEQMRILPSESFIGDMDAGDVFSASFTVDTSTLPQGENTLRFKLRFRDVSTGRMHETPPCVVKIFVEPQEERPARSFPLLATAFALFAVVILAFFVWWRRAR